MDNFNDSSKYRFTRAQNETLKEWDVSLRLDIGEIIDEWRVVDLLCELENLANELAAVNRERRRLCFSVPQPQATRSKG